VVILIIETNQMEVSMFFIPKTQEEIKAKLDEINNHVANVGADNINHFYAQALIEAYYTKFND